MEFHLLGLLTDSPTIVAEYDMYSNRRIQYTRLYKFIYPFVQINYTQ